MSSGLDLKKFRF